MLKVDATPCFQGHIPPKPVGSGEAGKSTPNSLTPDDQPVLSSGTCPPSWLHCTLTSSRKHLLIVEPFHTDTLFLQLFPVSFPKSLSFKQAVPLVNSALSILFISSLSHLPPFPQSPLLPSALPDGRIPFHHVPSRGRPGRAWHCSKMDLQCIFGQATPPPCSAPFSTRVCVHACACRCVCVHMHVWGLTKVPLMQ